MNFGPAGLLKPHPADKNPRAFQFVAIGLVLTIAAAFILGHVLGAPAAAYLYLSVEGFLVGAAAAAPMVVLLHLFMRVKSGPLARFRDSQIAYFAEIGFVFTRPRVAVMALGAGVSEELLFRGVLQVWAAGFMPVWLAILATNIIFGLLHARTALYALIAGVVGVYFGVLFALTGNLLVPIVAHALYDAVALAITRRAVDAHRPQESARP